MRVVISSDGDDKVDQYTQTTLKVVGFSIAQEISYNEDRQNQKDNMEELKVQILG